MAKPSIVKRIYDTVALFALLNTVGAGAVLCWLVGSGAVDTEKARRIVKVIRDQDDSEQPGDGAEQSESPPQAEEAPSGQTDPASSQWDAEIVRREADRVKEELRQRMALSNSILLRITAERESFKKERDAARQQERSAKAYRQTEGFAKQIAIYDSLTPKVALQHLLGLGSEDEAAGILLAMKTRQAKKIIEAAKRGDQRARMMDILQRLREVSPGRSAELVEE